MARLNNALKDNAEGNFYVDSSCINCGVSRHYAPEIFGDNGNYSYVKKQPSSEKEKINAIRALLACPTASIGMYDREDLTEARNEFPLKMGDDIFINGFNHKSSFGAHSYFIKSENGNWLIDSPRFNSILVKKFEDMGGIKYIFLTHRDDVCDAELYASHFKAKRIIHRYDSGAQKKAEIILDTSGRVIIDKGEIYHTPGHTKGHMVLLWKKKYLFTGDHFAYFQKIKKFGSFRHACWYSWNDQIESVKLMGNFNEVEKVFPGHGKWGDVAKGNFPEIINQAVAWMKTV